jgi:hypothetical protein
MASSRQCQEQIQQGSEQIDVKPSYGLSDVTKIAACCRMVCNCPSRHAIACIGGAQVDADRMILATFEVRWKRRPSQFKSRRVSTDDLMAELVDARTRAILFHQKYFTTQAL